MNEREENVVRIARAVGLRYIQLHGEESSAMVTRLGHALPVIRAIRVGDSFRPGLLARYRRTAGILLDGFDRRRRGGTGNTFDWKVAKRANQYAPIFLAGGLTPENVARAIRAVKPYAVDVCSGVEARPGEKDPRKLKRLMQAIRNEEKRKQ